ncbi:unnamed protein product [Toxocara canis]|uniref:Inner membrane protein n=1 Tax=Toxocara canis TaxID=6265 RepID=A0A183U0T3_TOXCA|nr:unnamed protein product [Toxocara canis]
MSIDGDRSVGIVIFGFFFCPVITLWLKNSASVIIMLILIIPTTIPLWIGLAALLKTKLGNSQKIFRFLNSLKKQLSCRCFCLSYLFISGTLSYLYEGAGFWYTLFIFWIPDGIWVILPLVVMCTLWNRLTSTAHSYIACTRQTRGSL